MRDPFFVLSRSLLDAKIAFSQGKLDFIGEPRSLGGTSAQ